jgi:hypothetical protein
MSEQREWCGRIRLARASARSSKFAHSLKPSPNIQNLKASSLYRPSYGSGDSTARLEPVTRCRSVPLRPRCKSIDDV